MNGDLMASYIDLLQTSFLSLLITNTGAPPALLTFVVQFVTAYLE